MTYGSVMHGAFGQTAPGLLSPPVVEEGGLTLLASFSKQASIWSVDNVTTMDPGAGATKKPLPPFPETEEWTAMVASPGDGWLTEVLGAGDSVVLLQKPDFQNLIPESIFVVTKSPEAVAALGKTGGNYIVMGGNRDIISAAQGAGPAPGKMGVCPPGMGGAWPLCQCPLGSLFNPLTGVCEAQLAKVGACPPGATGQWPNCLCPQGGTFEVLTGACAGGGQLPPPNGDKKEKGAKVEIQKAEAGVPTWLIPVLAVVGGVSLFAIVTSTQRRRT